MDWGTFCCNPFGKAKHSCQKKNLRPVLPWMCEKLPSLLLKDKVCDDCRKKLAKTSESVVMFESSQEGGGASSESEELFHQHESLEPIS